MFNKNYDILVEIGIFQVCCDVFSDYMLVVICIIVDSYIENLCDYMVLLYMGCYGWVMLDVLIVYEKV